MVKATSQKNISIESQNIVEKCPFNDMIACEIDGWPLRLLARGSCFVSYKFILIHQIGNEKNLPVITNYEETNQIQSFEKGLNKKLSTRWAAP